MKKLMLVVPLFFAAACTEGPNPPALLSAAQLRDCPEYEVTSSLYGDGEFFLETVNGVQLGEIETDETGLGVIEWVPAERMYLVYDSDDAPHSWIDVTGFVGRDVSFDAYDYDAATGGVGQFNSSGDIYDLAVTPIYSDDNEPPPF